MVICGLSSGISSGIWRKGVLTKYYLLVMVVIIKDSYEIQVEIKDDIVTLKWMIKWTIGFTNLK
jgi:hypothetical protein